MGMHDKDREIGLILQQTIPEFEHFIVWNASITNEAYNTDIGLAVQTTLTISPLNDPQGAARYDVTTLAQAIAAKVKEADADDFPFVGFWTTVPSKKAGRSDATVLRFVRMLNASPERTPGTAA